MVNAFNQIQQQCWSLLDDVLAFGPLLAVIFYSHLSLLLQPASDVQLNTKANS